MLTRRRLIQSGLGTAAAVSFGPAFWRSAFAQQPSTPTTVGPYGWLREPDANGIRLPPRFTSRVIAQSKFPVAGTGYTFPDYPDGAATFATNDGWILAVNSEIGGGAGGASGIKFAADGTILDAYPILTGTRVNCAGGPTPWGTWLSCEEVPDGRVYECDVTRNAPVAHDAMGWFQHEAACVDPDPLRQQVYLSEDVGGGGLYRYTPFAYPDLSAGTLEIACAGVGNKVTWKAVAPNPGGAIPETRAQHADSIKFARGEGIWYDSGHVYLATTTDETIHVYDVVNQTLAVLYRADTVPGTPLRGVDNVLVTKSGDLMVAEDSYTNDPDAMDVCLITRDNQISRFLKLTGNANFSPVQSETVSIAFNPDGSRMYVGSQRYDRWGILYEITGPFRSDQATVFQDVPEPTATPVPVQPAPTPGPTPPVNKPTPGVPIGLDVTRRLAERTFIRSGLAVGFTLENAATVRVRVTAKLGKRTKTLATVTRSVKAGRTMLRIKASKSGAKLLRGRRKDVKATVEIRITAPGRPAQTFKRPVTVRQ
jgi:hypothetical protein